jgi:hypothetical protein
MPKWWRTGTANAAGGLPLDSYYPGDDVVDVIGIDLYDSGMPGNPAQSCGSLGEPGPRAGRAGPDGAFARKHASRSASPRLLAPARPRSRSASATGMA